MDDLLNEFLTETAESLAVIDVELVKFEQEPKDAEILQNIFRLVHTIKGTSGFLGLPRLEKVAHHGEDVLGKFRDGELEVTPEAVTLILKAIDAIKALLAELEETGSEPDGDDSELINQLQAMADGGDPQPGATATTNEEEKDTATEESTGESATEEPSQSEEGFPVAAELLAEVEQATTQGVKASTDQEPEAELAAERSEEGIEPADGESQALNEPPTPAAESAEPAIDKAPEVPKDEPKAAPAKQDEERAPKESTIAAQSIRVNVELLENLMTLVSEMVLTRNQLMQMVRGLDDSEFHAPLQRLSLITTDLQEGVMKTRMQPIGNAWAKLPRIVRDLAVEGSKKIELKMLGAETELDRQVLELIKDPLTHMVRNSADHGLEMPEERHAAGKLETGTITLNAFHEGGHIIIEITDDGRGLNMDRIRTKIIDNGLASESDLEGMSDQQIQQFIFKAGFSTAEKVTNISGRGVGMDVVRTNIEKIGGTIELKSITGKGSVFTIKIPLTLAIVSALIVECGGERFAIPQISVLELVRASAHSEHAIEMINEAPVLRLRNRLLPLVPLRDLLKLNGNSVNGEAALAHAAKKGNGAGHDVEIETNRSAGIEDETDEKPATREGGGNGTIPAESEQEEETRGDELFIVVSQVGTYSFGIIVDRVFDTEEIVVKPVAPILRDISFYSGNTILGDGSVIMILDPNGIATSTGELAMGAEAGAEAEAVEVGHDDEKSTMLVFRAGGPELKAVPLALVARLEDIDMETIEKSRGEFVVQYRGRLVPLVPFNAAHQWKESGRQPILVFTDHERTMGLVVDEIVDIVEDHLRVELAANQTGIIGSAIIDGQATDVIDTTFYLTQAFADWFQREGHARDTESDSGKRVLLVDDSPFFRNLLKPVLSVAGYNVTTVESAGDALQMREDGADFDIIISDIEMPGMNGFEFAEAVRTDARWAKVPMVALSSHTDPNDFDRGREVGFNEYVAKSNRELLIQTLAQTVTTPELTPIDGAE